MSVHFPFALSLFAVLMVRGGRVLLALYALQLDAEPFTVGVLAAIFGFGMSVGQPITLSLSFSNAADGRSGELMGLRQSVNLATRIAIPVVFGGLAGLGSLEVFWASAALLVSGGLIARRGNMGELDK